MTNQGDTYTCGCPVLPRYGYCHIHDYTKVCWIEGCDLPFPHLPDGPEHRPACGCIYNNGGDFGMCDTHASWPLGEKDGR